MKLLLPFLVPPRHRGDGISWGENFLQLWQAIAKSALEPAHEATFHARNYGFRPGCSAHDAQKILFNITTEI
ncbi:hypothetical protein G1O98_36455 [Nostoc sp. UIC10630]|nr:hypothetical protein [Nostoc sp. UIC 10630]